MAAGADQLSLKSDNHLNYQHLIPYETPAEEYEMESNEYQASRNGDVNNDPHRDTGLNELPYNHFTLSMFYSFRGLGSTLVCKHVSIDTNFQYLKRKDVNLLRHLFSHEGCFPVLGCGRLRS